MDDRTPLALFDRRTRREAPPDSRPIRRLPGSRAPATTTPYAYKYLCQLKGHVSADAAQFHKV